MRVREKDPVAVMVHGSGTADSSRTLSWGILHRNLQRRYPGAEHPYHAGIEEVRGRIECLYGRPDYYPGAHCYGHNGDALGFCFVGEFDNDPPSDELLTAAAKRVIVPWLLQYGLDHTAVVPHRDYSATKTCPGAAFDIDRLRMIIARIMEDLT